MLTYKTKLIFDNQKVKDFWDAINAYRRETGGEVWNSCPEYTTSGDFVKWLLTKVKGNKVKGNGK